MAVVANVAINIEGKQAAAVLDEIKRKVEEMNGTLNRVPTATKNVNSVTSALSGIVAKLAVATTAAEVFRRSIGAAFERGAAEQKLKNITSGTQEYNAAIALASQASSRFGLTQTESSVAIADVYSKIKGLGYGLKETGDIFTGFNTIALQSGVSGAEAAGAFFQMSQALAKGKLNGDEFVSISERMPQLLDALVASTGRARGELLQMAGQGQLTGQMIYQALRQAGQGAGDLTSKLTEQQKALNNLRQGADQVLVVLGRLFLPAIIQGANFLGEAFKTLAANMPAIIAYAKSLLGPFIAIGQVVLPAVSQAFSAIIGNIKTIIQISAFFVTFVGTLRALTLVTTAWAAATNALATAKKVAAVAAAALQAIMNPATIGKIAIAIGTAAVASGLLGKAMDDAAKQAKGVKTEAVDIANKADEMLKRYSSLPPVIADAKEEAKQLKTEQRSVTDAVRETGEAYDRMADNANKYMDMQLQLADARYRAEIQITDLLLQQAKASLDRAATYDDQVRAAQRIYDLEVKRAKQILDQTLFQIKSEIQRARIAYDILFIKAKELESVVLLAQAQGVVTQEHYKALNAAYEAVDLARMQLEFTIAIGDENTRTAQAIYDSAVLAADLAYQQNIVAKATKSAADAQGKFNSELEATSKSSAWKLLGPITDPSQPGYVAERINPLTGNKETMRTFVVAQGAATSFAKGGYAAQPTLAMVGDGGEGEYLIPESKAAAFAMNYLSGSRGAGAVNTAPTASAGPINIQTGPVLQQDGRRYVTITDLEQALATMANAIFANSRSTGGRRFGGVS